MATVFVTFFLFARFYVCKMDAECRDTGRELNLSSKRLDRFSMDPQRFDEILAEITTGYGNIRSSFENVKIAEILEEMVTEYARAALEAEAPPNFAEVAVLLQHCAQLYGRKVDYLYQHAVDVCDALAAAPAPAPAPAAAPAGARARRRRASGAGAAAQFAHIPVAECAAARRGGSPPRPPPTLPRLYLELEPRVLAPHDRPLRDYLGEPVGLPADFHVAWRLQDGYLVEELAMSRGEGGALRPLSLVELQAAISAAAPPSPPPPPCTPPPPSPAGAPLCASTPLPSEPEPEPPAPEPPEPPPVPLRRRKRRSSTVIADVFDGSLEMFTPGGAAGAAGRRPAEFAPEPAWVARVVALRARRLLAARRALAPPAAEFRGFEDEYPDIGGFRGWSPAAGAAARGGLAAARALDLESDDDGFFERSSFSSSDCSRADCFAPPDAPATAVRGARAEPPAAAAAEAAAWGAGVAARALREAARGAPDVRALGAAVLRALAPAPRARPVAALLAALAAEPRDVARLLLAALFLANSGNVALIAGPPLSVNSFSVELLNPDERLMQVDAAPDGPAGPPDGPARPPPPAGPPDGPAPPPRAPPPAGPA